MSEMMKINYLPAPTWNWLKMNVAETEKPDGLEAAAPAVEKPQGVVQALSAEFHGGIPTGMGADMDALMDAAGAEYTVFTAAAQDEPLKPVRLGFTYEGAQASAARVGLEAEEGASLFAIMDFAGDASGAAAVQTRVGVGKGALVKLVQIQHFGEGLTFFNDIGVDCAEGGRFELIQVVIGGKETYMGVRDELAGGGSSFKSDLGYLLTGGDKLDLNFTASHTGKKTDSQISVNGVLRDSASKLFRGTIDFRKGASGATGDEKEDVLLLSEGVVNQTIPLILCAEEDVEGGHGATIGRVDEELLFYLESRGIPEEAVYEMLATARIDAVGRLIPDERARRLVSSCIGSEEEEDD